MSLRSLNRGRSGRRAHWKSTDGCLLFSLRGVPFTPKVAQINNDRCFCKRKAEGHLRHRHGEQKGRGDAGRDGSLVSTSQGTSGQQQLGERPQGLREEAALQTLDCRLRASIAVRG